MCEIIGKGTREDPSVGGPTGNRYVYEIIEKNVSVSCRDGYPTGYRQLVCI